jgi:hypothetical protein
MYVNAVSVKETAFVEIPGHSDRINASGLYRQIRRVFQPPRSLLSGVAALPALNSVLREVFLC